MFEKVDDDKNDDEELWDDNNLVVLRGQIICARCRGIFSWVAERHIYEKIVIMAIPLIIETKFQRHSSQDF